MILACEPAQGSLAYPGRRPGPAVTGRHPIAAGPSAALGIWALSESLLPGPGLSEPGPELRAGRRDLVTSARACQGDKDLGPGVRRTVWVLPTM